MNRWMKAGAAMAGIAAGTYGAWAATAWVRYGRIPRRDPAERDELLDRFIPVYDVHERHAISVNAPPTLAVHAAATQDLLASPLISAIFTARELVMGSSPGAAAPRAGLLETTLSIGWRVLAEVPGREIVVGAVTQPWRADVTFRGLESDAFAAFAEPDYVKIAWTLRADPVDDGTRSHFSTETRAVATDAEAARKFRMYWALASPGISLIRALSLPGVKASAERAFRGEPSPRPSAPHAQPTP